MVEPEQVLAWQAAKGDMRAVHELGAELPQVLAEAALSAFAEIDGPEKRRFAGHLAACWFVMSCAVVDHLRKFSDDVPEVQSPYPEAITRLQKIARG